MTGTNPSAGAATEVDVAVVGAGLAGVGLGARLRRAGRTGFAILERADDVGGTWRDNVYPGVACDIPSALYSYSFLPQPAWSRGFAPGAEINLNANFAGSAMSTWQLVPDTRLLAAQMLDLLPHLTYDKMD